MLSFAGQKRFQKAMKDMARSAAAGPRKPRCVSRHSVLAPLKLRKGLFHAPTNAFLHARLVLSRQGVPCSSPIYRGRTQWSVYRYFVGNSSFMLYEARESLHS